jgi:hypothetical protein
MPDDIEMPGDPNAPTDAEPRRGPIYWIFRVLAGALGALLVAGGIVDVTSGARASGIRTIFMGLLFVVYAITGGRYRRRRARAGAQKVEGIPKPIE